MTKQRSLIIDGWQWYCDIPEIRWSRSDGHYLFFTDGRQWWLMGNGVELATGETSLKKAANSVAGLLEELKRG